MPGGRAEIMCLVTWCCLICGQTHHGGIRSVTEPSCMRMKKLRQDK